MEDAHGAVVRGQHFGQALVALRRLVGPAAGDGGAREIYVALGRGEMRAGRSLDALLSAYRLGARLAWEHFVAAGEAAGHEPRTLYRLATAIFEYIDGISAESIEGFTQERAAAEGEAQRRRRALARLLARDDVAAVYYAGLPTSPWYAAANKYAPRGVGAVLSFELKGGVDAGRALVDALELFSHLANIGDAKSLAIHNATTTHSQLTPDELDAAGVPEDMVRLSIGIEHVDDLVADLEQALAASKG